MEKAVGFLEDGLGPDDNGFLRFYSS